MSQWLSTEMAQGLAFNAGSNFDPPKEVQGYSLQPDVSLGVGNMPLDKRQFPVITTPALNQYGASNLFPNSVLFPNLALHLRMGLPWRGDFYIRGADATTPPGYKISPTMTAKVQSNSYGAGIRQHFFGDDYPVLTVGAHYNHVQGYTHINGKFNVNIVNGGQTLYNANDTFTGDIGWSVNSFGLTAIASQSFGAWTPFAGLGYNYASGSVHAGLTLQSSTFLVPDITGEGSDHPEKSQGREIFGFSYDRSTWSLFANAELKALGQLQYRSYIVQFGGALPFDIGRGPAIFYKKRGRQPAAAKAGPDDGSDAPETPPARRPRAEPPAEQDPSGLIYIR